MHNTLVQVALLRCSDDRIDILRDTMSELLGMDEPRKRFGAMMSGLDIQYDIGKGHALLGRRMPDLDVVTTNGPMRVFSVLQGARPVFLNLGETGRSDISPWSDRVQLIDATYDGLWELPTIGAVTPTQRIKPPENPGAVHTVYAGYRLFGERCRRFETRRWAYLNAPI